MISKRIRILALTLVSCSCLLSLGMGQQQTSVSISSLGTISFKRSYICGNYNSTHYYAQNNANSNYELISTDATQTISYASSKLTSGRTWQETVLLRGNFSIYTTIALNSSNALLDFSQATVTLAASIAAFSVNGNNNTFYGGRYDPFTNTGTHSHWIGQSGATAILVWSTNCVVDGFEFSGFTGASSVLIAASGSSYNTFQNCYIHDGANVDGNCFINLIAPGVGHSVINCRFDVNCNGVMGNSGVSRTKVRGCEFYGWRTGGGHAIYFGGSDPANSGYNEINGCTFHNGVNGAGCHIKSQFNSIHDNTFYDITTNGAVPISLYSELSGYLANDNDIYNNTFTNCYFAIWLGHNTAGNDPTLRNKIHDNVFTNVTYCIRLIATSNTVEDTKIYYNDFHSCANPFPSVSSASLIMNTVIAYNYFDASVPNANVAWLQSCVNSMSYQNTFFPPNTSLAMANYNYSEATNPASWYYVAPRA